MVVRIVQDHRPGTECQTVQAHEHGAIQVRQGGIPVKYDPGQVLQQVHYNARTVPGHGHRRDALHAFQVYLHPELHVILH